MNRTGYHWELYTYLTNIFRKKKEPLKKFVIFTVGRSGSSLLVSLLNSNPKIHCYGELLGKKLISPTRYYQQVALINHGEIFGFKLNTFHFRIQHIGDPVRFVDNLHDEGFEIISLRRENILRQIFSHIYAVKRGKFFHTKREGQQKHSPIHVDLELLRREIILFEGYQELEEKILSTVPHLSLSYERDLVDRVNQQATINRLTSLLGTKPGIARTDFVITTPKDLSRIILNYDEIHQYLMTTQYAELVTKT